MPDVDFRENLQSVVGCLGSALVSGWCQRSPFHATDRQNTCKTTLIQSDTPYEQGMRRSLTRLNSQLANELQSLSTPRTETCPKMQRRSRNDSGQTVH